MQKIILIIFAFVSFSLTAATNPKEAYSLVKEGKAIFVDVREESEIKEGMIEKATWLPISKISANGDWQKDLVALAKDKKIFLYCRTGNRSGKAQSILKAKGIESENIGGFESLKNDLPTTKAK